jgi:hypothetical protein
MRRLQRARRSRRRQVGGIFARCDHVTLLDPREPLDEPARDRHTGPPNSILHLCRRENSGGQTSADPGDTSVNRPALLETSMRGRLSSLRRTVSRRRATTYTRSRVRSRRFLCTLWPTGDFRRDRGSKEAAHDAISDPRSSQGRTFGTRYASRRSTGSETGRASASATSTGSCNASVVRSSFVRSRTHAI